MPNLSPSLLSSIKYFRRENYIYVLCLLRHEEVRNFFHFRFTTIGRIISVALYRRTRACIRDIKSVVKRVDKQLVGEHLVVDISTEMFLGIFPRFLSSLRFFSRERSKYTFPLKSEALAHKYIAMPDEGARYSEANLFWKIAFYVLYRVHSRKKRNEEHATSWADFRGATANDVIYHVTWVI